MSYPFEWRISDVEKKAAEAYDRLWQLDAARSDVARLERTVGELSTCIAGLRSALEATLSRVESLEREVSSLSIEASHDSAA